MNLTICACSCSKDSSGASISGHLYRRHLLRRPSVAPSSRPLGSYQHRGPWRALRRSILPSRTPNQPSFKPSEWVHRFRLIILHLGTRLILGQAPIFSHSLSNQRNSSLESHRIDPNGRHSVEKNRGFSIKRYSQRCIQKPGSIHPKQWWAERAALTNKKSEKRNSW